MSAPKDDPFTRRVLGVSGDSQICLIAKQSIAKRFGWDTAFPEWSPPFRVLPDGSRRYTVTPHATGQRRYRGGHAVYISTDSSTTGQPVGKTYRFRMIGPWSKKHQKQLAEVAGERFEWMENRKGQRVSRADWLS